MGCKGVSKIKKYNEKKKKAKLPPTPTDVMNGIVATVVLEHYQLWNNNQFRFKNIEIYGRDVSIGRDTLDANEELTLAIAKSKDLHKEWNANKLKYEKEQRMLNHLEEFMGIETKMGMPKDSGTL